MFQKRVLQLCGVVLAMTYCDFAIAQPPTRPASDVSGNAGSELSKVYRRDIGTGYSGSSLNSIALNSARARVGNYGQQTTRSGSIGVGLEAGPTAKPFSSFSPSPTTSPYLNLFREDLDGSSDFNYQTLVRPMLQQQQFNQRMQQQGVDIARRLQAISAQADFNPEGSQTQYPTGHQTAQNYYGHYYPALNAGRRGR